MTDVRNLVTDAPTRKNYDFIDHIRCIAIISIVAEHSIGGYAFEVGSAKFWGYLGYVQLAKFGTVIFFLLAGFLISEKFTDYTPLQYIKRRFSNTFGPWVFWSLIYVACMIINYAVKERMYHDGRLSAGNILNGIEEVYLYSNYWFIINFMISISLLLIFKRHLYSYRFGGILLLFTLFYNVNIHFEWIRPSHTVAILGFVFYLWLGAQLRRHWVVTETTISKLPWALAIVGVLITFGLAIGEAEILRNHHSVDPTNTLRFTNVLYSLAVFVLLLKVKNFPALNCLKPRQTTYGIYLIHYIIVIFAVPEIFHPFHIDFKSLPLLQFFALKLLALLLAYGITLALVLLINATRAKKIIGN